MPYKVLGLLQARSQGGVRSNPPFDLSQPIIRDIYTRTATYIYAHCLHIFAIKLAKYNNNIIDNQWAWLPACPSYLVMASGHEPPSIMFIVAVRR